MSEAQQPGPSEQQPLPTTPEQEPRLTLRIWAGSLADYNHGDLHGEWLDAARDSETIHADIQAMLARGPAARRGETPEEWGVFDYDGFGPLRIGEYEAIERISALALAIAEHGPAFAAYAAISDPDDDVTTERFIDAYQGRFDSVVDYARELTDDLGYRELLEEALPPHIRSYVSFDYEQFAQDLQAGGDITTADAESGGLFIFRTE